MFPKNEGPADRAIRVGVGIVLLALGLFVLDALQGSVVGLVVGIIGLAILITGATGRCLIYIPFGISTLKESRASQAAPKPRQLSKHG